MPALAGPVAGQDVAGEWMPEAPRCNRNGLLMSDHVTSFLLLHGTIVWLAVLAAFVLAVFVAIDRVRRARARRWVRGEASSLDLPTSDRVIRGILEGGDASTTTRRGTHVHERAVELSVVTPDGRIPLVGDVHVIAGSAMHADGRASRCELGSGDEVIVHGTLERAAVREELDYRANPTTFALRGAPLLATAVHPASAIARLSFGTIVLVAVATGLFGFEVERSLGHIWRARCDAQQGKADLSATSACVLAAATPGNADMPQHLISMLERTRRTRADAEREVWLGLLIDECEPALRALEDTQQWRLLVPLARQCHAPSREQLGLVALGYFDAAAKIDLDYGPFRTTAAILAEDWALAAHQLERSIASTGGTAVERCKVQLFKYWAGDRDAAIQLRASKEYDCFRAQEEVVRGTVDVWHEFGSYSAIDEVQAVSAAFNPSAVDLWGSRVWTSGPAITPGTETADTIAIRDARAVHRLMRGDTEGAIAEAAEIDAFVAAHDLWYGRAPLARQLSLFTPTLEIPTDLPPKVPDSWHQLAHVFLRAGKPFAANLDGVTISVLQAAQDGDGRALARSIVTDDSPLSDFDLLAVLPRVRLGRSELVDAIRTIDHMPHDFDRSPWANATHAFVRSAILEMAGDPIAAAPWREIFRRYDAALSSHRVQLALAL